MDRMCTLRLVHSLSLRVTANNFPQSKQKYTCVFVCIHTCRLYIYIYIYIYTHTYITYIYIVFWMILYFKWINLIIYWQQSYLIWHYTFFHFVFYSFQFRHWIWPLYIKLFKNLYCLLKCKSDSIQFIYLNCTRQWALVYLWCYVTMNTIKLRMF